MIYKNRFKKGQIPWNKGKKHTLKTRQKMSQSLKGRKVWNKGKKLHYSVWNKGLKGIHFSPKTEFKKNEHLGEKNWNWKGEKAPYRAKHQWVENNFGNPQKCEFCQKDNLKGHQIHWANIGEEFKRDRKDWIRLCPKCHGKYDKQKRNLTF